jgi:hypothetical protein
MFLNSYQKDSKKKFIGYSENIDNPYVKIRFKL